MGALRYALMKLGEATMNVPPDKVAQYQADGWKIVHEVSLPDADVPVEDVATEIDALPVPERTSAKGRRKK